ncbi:hypothetical protein I4F81_008929 [Pyropia yezoensis]|uniref:Uncharacterized protein n=1 Tax=Pyropia yezoensis TaxID=2788 RepID=A0ACC3C8Y8_PYRYE|nr:hypothetical protein I4F81_008929 [Neopyropia yezoensis]
MHLTVSNMTRPRQQWGEVWEGDADCEMNFRVLFMAVALSTLAVVSAVDARMCTFSDACNRKRIKAQQGHSFTDSCDKMYRVIGQCRLQRVCSYSDACSNKLLVVMPGETFVDSCGKTYKVRSECRLQRVCTFSDACNGRSIVAAPGKTFIDSCGNKYIVKSTCKLHRV